MRSSLAVDRREDERAWRALRRDILRARLMLEALKRTHYRALSQERAMGIASLRDEEWMRTFERSAFNPMQPRVPAGNPDGGEWTDGGGGGDSGIPTAIPVSARNRTYSVVLEDEEIKGGHTIRDHVGKSDEYLIDEVRQKVIRGIFADYFQIAEGSFSDTRSANDFVNRVLEANRSSIDAVADGLQAEAVLDMRFGYRTGKEAYHSDEDEEPYIRPTYAVRVVVRPYSGPPGYRILTAFPTNQH